VSVYFVSALMLGGTKLYTGVRACLLVCLLSIPSAVYAETKALAIRTDNARAALFLLLCNDDDHLVCFHAQPGASDASMENPEAGCAPESYGCARLAEMYKLGWNLTPLDFGQDAGEGVVTAAVLPNAEAAGLFFARACALGDVSSCSGPNHVPAAGATSQP